MYHFISKVSSMYYTQKSGVDARKTKDLLDEVFTFLLRCENKTEVMIYL